MNQAQLITPEGKTIVLPEHIYFRVMAMLAVERPAPKMTREEIEQIIKRTRGSWKVEGKRSMTDALLEFRREDRELERKRDREIHKRFYSKRKRRSKVRSR